MNTHYYKKTFHVSLLATVVIYVSIVSFNSIRANAWYFSAVNEIKAFNTAIDKSKAEKKLNSAKVALEKSVLLEPTHPHYLHMLSYVDLQLLNFSSSNKNISTFNIIEKNLIRSLEYRATWPATWVLLAHVKSHQQGASQAVYEALLQAKYNGPYILDVHVGAITIAMQNWDSLTPEFKQLYVNELALAMRHGYKALQLFEYAERYDKQKLLCLSLMFSDNYKQIRSTYKFKSYCKEYL
ncbi:VpsP family polysaccharide biosynthesis protein [Pseudoalteromonas elyakovii]|nr:VpsP family polysaccharide biosynthesis protein [Pseudoalteromonas elyakovii]